MGCTHPTPLWGAIETTSHSSEKWKILTIDAWDDFDNTGRKSFSYLKKRSQKSKKIVKGGCTPPTNPSPIKNICRDGLIALVQHRFPTKWKKWRIWFLEVLVEFSHSSLKNFFETKGIWWTWLSITLAIWFIWWIPLSSTIKQEMKYTQESFWTPNPTIYDYNFFPRTKKSRKTLERCGRKSTY